MIWKSLSGALLQETLPGEPPLAPDFRWQVFAAYGAAILLLFLFSLWSAAQVRAAERKLDRLLERIDRTGK